MAYREPASLPPPPPQSPDLDPALFQTPWWRSVLIVSLLGLPPYLVLEWTGNMASKVNGHAYPVTLTQHVVKTVIIALWLAALFLVRARHRRRERAIYLALQSENARVRVAMNDELEVRVPLEQDEAEPYPEVEADVAKQRRANRPPASRR